MASTPSSDGRGGQQEVDNCVQAFKSGNKLMVAQLLPRIQQPAVVRTTSESLCFSSSTVANVSLLHLAARWGWIDIAVLLITEHNCSAKWRDKERNIPLHYAAYYGHLELMKYFITELHCNPRARNESNDTPLHLACINGHLNIVQCLISDLHCNPSCVNKDSITPLHHACSNGRLNIVQYLISEVHCNPSSVDYIGDTPLHHACSNHRQRNQWGLGAQAPQKFLRSQPFYQ